MFALPLLSRGGKIEITLLLDLHFLDDEKGTVFLAKRDIPQPALSSCNCFMVIAMLEVGRGQPSHFTVEKMEARKAKSPSFSKSFS